MGWFTQNVYDPEPVQSVKITFDDMRSLYIDGVIGTRELRNWLGKVDANFNSIRDSEVDNQIDRLAREREEAYRLQVERKQQEG